MTITIRRVGPDDAAAFARMMNEPEVYAGLMQMPHTNEELNERAIALYRKFGFEVEGRHRGYAMRDGCYVDVFAMARLHPRPPVIGQAAP